MSELFDTSTFSSKNDATRDFEIEGNSSKKKMQKSSYKSDSAWDDGSAFPEISSSEAWTIGDRIAASGDDKRKPSLGTVTGVNKKITITWQNGLSAEYTPKQMQSYGYYKFLEDGAMSMTTPKENAVCNSHNLTSAQDLAQGFASQGCNSDLNSLEPQRLTSTAQTSLNCDIHELTTMETCKVLPIQEPLGYDQEQSISSQLPRPAPHSPQKAIAKEQPMSETVSPQSLKLLISTNQNSQQSKTSQVCSLVPTSLEMSAVTSGMFYSSFPPAGMMRTGLLSEAATVPLPLLEKEYCWLPSPGALSFSGKGRPPGQTKQEGGLKDLGLLQKGEVLNPDILCEWYGLPPNWLDPSESRAATELLENNERQQEICLIPELQRSPSTELSISTQLQRKVSRGDTPPGDGSSFKRGNPANGLPQLCKKSKLAPEIFLEETQPQPEAVQKPKGRQRKGCLYRYIENKKLKSGDIASYPRVIGHRSPDNPTHWRWGFNWEEKVDGEWKGRSIGSVPLGAIALIQSMQNEGVPLEEIIGFIRRAKAKKC